MRCVFQEQLTGQSLQLEPTSDRVLREQPAVMYDDTVRVTNGSHAPGPGRGHTGKREGTALEQADSILKKPRPTLPEALGPGPSHGRAQVAETMAAPRCLAV